MALESFQNEEGERAWMEEHGFTDSGPEDDDVQRDELWQLDVSRCPSDRQRELDDRVLTNRIDVDLHDDRLAAQDLLRVFCEEVEAGRIPPGETLRYLAGAFRKIVGDTIPKDSEVAKALRLRLSRRGRSNKTREDRDREWRMTYEFLTRCPEGKDVELTRAEVADLFVPPSTVAMVKHACEVFDVHLRRKLQEAESAHDPWIRHTATKYIVEMKARTERLLKQGGTT